ncbi:MAG: imidazolonepropionase [Minwuiales bacterium]|nr:imidazolonepropionase [Minwuiales bacterium]
MWDAIWINANLATMTTGSGPYGAITDGALGLQRGRLTYVGPAADLPSPPEQMATSVHNADGAWITPGLIDPHTHIVYGGNRAGEFEMRLQGATYEEIARAGGGIVSTVAATRDADESDLTESGRVRLERLAAEGVTTVEIKSGYGLNTETENKMLRVARRLERLLPITVRTTFLGAHALPPEYQGKPDEYIDLVCEEMLPAANDENLVDAVDAFCETIGFTATQTERVFEAARALDLPVKLHAEQLSDQQGAQLLARFGGLSADHLEYVSEDGVKALARAGSVAVLLPGAFYFLRETKLPPVDLFRRHNVPMALATDSNPGSSPATSLLLMLNMACTLFRMTPEEALAGVTRNAARALGMAESHGTLEQGKTADFVLWDIDRPAELAYAIGANPCLAVIRSGEIVRRAA